MDFSSPTTRRATDDRRLVRLWFAGDDGPPSGDLYHVRGGIAWPMRSVSAIAGSTYEGYAISSITHVESGVVYVMDQLRWLTMTHVVDPDTGEIQFRGLADWLVRQYANLFCTDYYWHQPFETARRHILSASRTPELKPSPHWIELDWTESEAEQVYSIVYEYDATGRIVYPAGSRLHNELQEFDAAEGQERRQFPAVHALSCLLFGLSNAPPRRPDTW